jgi:hypothetical protein
MGDDGIGSPLNNVYPKGALKTVPFEQKTTSAKSEQETTA